MFKINTICTVNGGGYGTLDIHLEDGTSVQVKLTDEEARRIQALGETIYSERQKAIAEQIAKPLPALADFTEVANFTEVDDNIQF